ncbi:hypothetical protein L2D01_10015 [Hyphomonadaceae bacterium ML37]|nr:hypothetical protein L2D01_10015 [Hyphomonadaceae bacterium ML37]
MYSIRKLLINSGIIFSIAVINIIVIASNSFSQSLNGPFTISERGSNTFSHSSSDRYKYIVYSVYLNSGSVGIVGFRRTSGIGNNDIRVGTGVAPSNAWRASVTGVVASDTTNDQFGDILMFANDGSSGRRYYLEAWSVDDRPGTWTVRYTSFNVGEAIGQAIGSAAVEWLIVCGVMNSCNTNQSEANRNVGRALDLGMSVLQRDNVCSVGTDFVVNEVRNELARELGQGFALMALTAFVREFVSDVAWAQCY